MLSGWLSGAFNSKLHNTKFYSTTWIEYTHDWVKRPSNADKDYIMAFNAPEGTSDQTKELLNKVLSDYISEWKSSDKYYACGQDNLDSTAKSCLTVARKKIQDNKNVLKGRGFSGTYKFYVQKTKDGSQIDSFELTF